MAFITAIDNAINKDHADAQRQADRDHEAQMNKEFADMLKQNEEMNLEYIKMTNQANAEADAAFQQYFGGGTTGGGTTGGSQTDQMYQMYGPGAGTNGGGYTAPTETMTMDQIMAMFNQPNGGANYNPDGTANFDKGAGNTFVFNYNAGPNYDVNGNADFTGGTNNPIPRNNADPFSFWQNQSQNSGQPRDPAQQFGNAGIDTSWMNNTGHMMNMNDLIAFFDWQAGQNSRPGTTPQTQGNQPSTGSTSTDGNSSSTTTAPSDVTTPVEPSDPVSSDRVNIEVNVDDGVSSEVKGELEDLALKIESAIEKGILTEAEGKKMIRDLEEKANSTADVDVDHGRIWGDPHFEGADGEKYDVQGEAGKTYNLLSDKGLQVNATFEEWGGKNSGATTMGEVGITIGEDQVKFDKNGDLEINGEAIKEDGTYLDGAVTLKDGKLSVKTDEYSFDVEPQENSRGDYLNIENIRSDNANADGVMPSGLWGGTVDGDGEARTGDSGRGAQGGGAIEETDGDISQRGDKDTVKSYEVDDLFDTEFKDHNQFSDKPEVTEESVGEDIDRVYGQLEKLEAIQDKAAELHDEIDLRLEKGQLSEAQAKLLHGKVDEVADISKGAVLDTDDTNDVDGREMSDEDVLTKAMAGFERLDASLNNLNRPLVSIDEPTNTSDPDKDVVTLEMVPAGSNVGTDTAQANTEKVDTAAVADQLKSLEWA